MPQHINARSFTLGDPRAVAAGRKGGKIRRGRGTRTPDYITGYHAGSRNARRHIHRWIQEQTMDRLGSTPFAKAAMALHHDQRAAKTPDERHAADEALSHMLRMAGAGRFEEWLASHTADVDDRMSANMEECA